MIKLGEKIKALRKERNISQEILANYLGVSFQAVSKWETGSTMPDVTLIPAIASFFRVSTDELFEFNMYEMEKEIEDICYEAYKYRYAGDMEQSERVLREGLQRFPGNERLLNCLLCALDYQKRATEVIDLCNALIESCKDDEIKYAACRILAECYKANGKDEMIKPILEKIPEIYFTKLELEASLLDGERHYEAAQKQKNISAESLINMLIITGKHLKEMGEKEKADAQFRIALKVIDAFEDDFLEKKWFVATVPEYMSKQREEAYKLLHE